MRAWHNLAIDAIAEAFEADVQQGLSSEEAAQRLARYGANELRKGKRVSMLAILVGQFKSLVTWVLIGAASISIALGELADGVAILAIVILNALIGFFRNIGPRKRPLHSLV